MFEWTKGSNEPVVERDFLSSIGGRDSMREYGHSQPLDTYELLSTKLAPPRPHTSLVSLATPPPRLDETPQHKHTLPSAPAGFRKSTPVSPCIAARSERQEALP